MRFYVKVRREILTHSETLACWDNEKIFLSDAKVANAPAALVQVVLGMTVADLNKKALPGIITLTDIRSAQSLLAITGEIIWLLHLAGASPKKIRTNMATK